MKLRIFQTYDKNGVDSEKRLQVWNQDILRWEDIPFVRCSYEREETAMRNLFY